MEYIFEKHENGIVVNTISLRAKNYYIKSGQCPECNCSLQIFKTGWKEGDFVYIHGENVGKFKTVTYAMCPICGNYFDTSFKPIENGLEFYKDL